MARARSLIASMCTAPSAGDSRRAAAAWGGRDTRAAEHAQRFTTARRPRRGRDGAGAFARGRRAAAHGADGGRPRRSFGPPPLRGRVPLVAASAGPRRSRRRFRARRACRSSTACSYSRAAASHSFARRW